MRVTTQRGFEKVMKDILDPSDWYSISELVEILKPNLAMSYVEIITRIKTMWYDKKLERAKAEFDGGSKYYYQVRV